MKAARWRLSVSNINSKFRPVKPLWGLARAMRTTNFLTRRSKPSSSRCLRLLRRLRLVHAGNVAWNRADRKLLQQQKTFMGHEARKKRSHKATLKQNKPNCHILMEKGSAGGTLKSGSWVTPGQMSSLGVLKTRKMRKSWSISESPWNAQQGQRPTLQLWTGFYQSIPIQDFDA